MENNDIAVRLALNNADEQRTNGALVSVGPGCDTDFVPLDVAVRHPWHMPGSVEPVGEDQIVVGFQGDAVEGDAEAPKTLQIRWIDINRHQRYFDSRVGVGIVYGNIELPRCR